MQSQEMMYEINKQLNFISFLTSLDLLDCLIGENMNASNFRHSPAQYNNDLDIKLSTKKILNTQFYKKMFGISEGVNVAKIMLEIHKQYNIPVYTENGNSGVGVNPTKRIIEGEIHSTPTIQGFEIMAHETGHARSGKNLKHISLLNKISTASTAQEKEHAQRELDGFLREKSQCEYDCIGEIDTITIEKLFLWFLENNAICKNILNNCKFDMNLYKQEYEREHENIIYNHIDHIVKTKNLFDKYGITQSFKSETEFQTFLSNLPNQTIRNEFIADMEKILEKPNAAEAGKGAKYRFRYIIGEAVSKYWFDKFTNCTSKEERKEMLNEFTKFWKGSDILNAHQACIMLCDGKSIKDIVVSYLEQSQIHSTTQNSTITP